jgi:hypothetical protein
MIAILKSILLRNNAQLILLTRLMLLPVYWIWIIIRAMINNGWMCAETFCHWHLLSVVTFKIPAIQLFAHITNVCYSWKQYWIEIGFSKVLSALESHCSEYRPIHVIWNEILSNRILVSGAWKSQKGPNQASTVDVPNTGTVWSFFVQNRLTERDVWGSILSWYKIDLPDKRFYIYCVAKVKTTWWNWVRFLFLRNAFRNG